MHDTLQIFRTADQAHHCFLKRGFVAYEWVTQREKNRWEEKVPALQGAGRMMPCFGSALSRHANAVLLWPGHPASQFRVYGKSRRNVFSCGGECI